MSWINNQVKLGEPLMVHRQPQHVNLTPMLYGFSRLGIVPGMGGGPQVSPLAIGGFVIGGGLVVGGIFVKGPGGVVMSVVGGIAAGFSLITTLLGMMGPSVSSVPSSESSFPSIPSRPSPPVKVSRTQQIEQFAQALAPTALPIFKNLFKSGSSSSTPAPAPTSTSSPAPSSGIPGLVTSFL